MLHVSQAASLDARVVMGYVHVDKGFGIGKRPGQLDVLEDLAVAVQWRIARR